MSATGDAFYAGQVFPALHVAPASTGELRAYRSGLIVTMFEQ